MNTTRRGFFRGFAQGVGLALAVTICPGVLKAQEPKRRKLTAVWTMEPMETIYAEYGLNDEVAITKVCTDAEEAYQNGKPTLTMYEVNLATYRPQHKPTAESILGVRA